MTADNSDRAEGFEHLRLTGPEEDWVRGRVGETANPPPLMPHEARRINIYLTSISTATAQAAWDKAMDGCEAWLEQMVANPSQINGQGILRAFQMELSAAREEISK